MVFLKDESQYPLSVFLASLDKDGFSLGFHSGLLSLLPAVLLLLYFRQELVEGSELLMEREKRLAVGLALGIGIVLFLCTAASQIIYWKLLPQVERAEGTVTIRGVYHPDWVYASNADSPLQNGMEISIVAE